VATRTKKPNKQIDAKKEAKTETRARKSKGDVRLDPNLPLVAGNTANFVARQAKGVATAKVETDRGSWIGQVSNSPAGARISKIIETGHTELKVTFYEDGKEYASGTFPVA